MCRLYGFLANEETKVECSLVHAQNALMLQSRADLRGKSHPDGWGIAFYQNSRPEVERRATAAYEDIFFSETVERIYARGVLAHVRQATVGRPSLENSHPFTHGMWSFAHNGTVTGFAQLRDSLLEETDERLRDCIHGSTDSEHVFYWLLSRMRTAGIGAECHCDCLSGLLDVVARATDILAQLSSDTRPERPAKLNFLLTDGVVMVASRWKNSLHWVFREGIHDCEICGIPHVHHHAGVDYRAVVVASEPITHEEWRTVPERHILAVDANGLPRIHSTRALVGGEEPAPLACD